MRGGGNCKACLWRTLPHAAVCLLMACPPASAGDPKRGEPMYQRYCSGCHGTDGRGGGKNFMPHVGALNKKGHTELLDDGYVTSIITEGGPAFGKSGYMPSFKGTLSPDDIADVIGWVATRPRHVDIDEIVVRPVAQAAQHKVHRVG